jgi:hypothetical protein
VKSRNADIESVFLDVEGQSGITQRNLYLEQQFKSMSDKLTE